ncbi:MAG: hypothetical protein NTV98_04070 [Candidatus Roizmanbacteria bacterium]|nr:hypothetical protein [Candidatus Roizmanbacteria bacterium]
MHLYNKLILSVFILLLLVVVGEGGYYYYLCKLPQTNGTKYINLYSLRTVKESKDFTSWLTKNGGVSTTEFAVDTKNTPIIIVETSGNIVNLAVENNTASFSLKRNNILINYTLPIKDAAVYNGPKSGISLSAKTLKENDSILAHEVFTFQNDKIVPLDVRLVKNREAIHNAHTSSVVK